MGQEDERYWILARSELETKQIDSREYVVPGQPARSTGEGKKWVVVVGWDEP